MVAQKVYFRRFREKGKNGFEKHLQTQIFFMRKKLPQNCQKNFWGGFTPFDCQISYELWLPWIIYWNSVCFQLSFCYVANPFDQRLPSGSQCVTVLPVMTVVTVVTEVTVVTVVTKKRFPTKKKIVQKVFFHPKKNLPKKISLKIFFLPKNLFHLKTFSPKITFFYKKSFFTNFYFYQRAFFQIHTFFYIKLFFNKKPKQ